MPMTKQERDSLKGRLVALQAAEEVEATLKLLRKAPPDSEVALRLTCTEWQQVNSRSAPSNAVWGVFARELEGVLEAYAERLLEMARGMGPEEGGSVSQ